MRAKSAELESGWSIYSISWRYIVVFALLCCSYFAYEITRINSEIERLTLASNNKPNLDIQWFKLGEIDKKGILKAKNIYASSSVTSALMDIAKTKQADYKFKKLITVTTSQSLNIRSTPAIKDNKLPITLSKGVRVEIAEISIIKQWVWARKIPPKD